jgi:hypothetical protein
MTVVG